MMGPSYRDQVSYRVVIILCGAIASGVAIVALLGWGLGMPTLASMGSGIIPMAPSTAVLFLLYGLTVILRTHVPPRRGSQRACVAIHVVGGLVSLTLLCMSFQGIYVDIEHLGFQAAVGLGDTPVGHMSPLTALFFLVAGASFLLSLSVSRDRPWRGIASLGLAASLSGAGFVLLLAYVYGSPLFYTGSFIPPAAPTSVAFAALGISLAALAAPHAVVKLPVVRAEPTKRASMVLAAIFVLLSLGIILVGYFYTRHYGKQYRAEVERQLVATADLKVGELTQWKRERLGDAAVLHKNEAFTTLVRRFLDTPEDTLAAQELRTWLDQFQAAFRFDRVFLLDSRGEERLWAPEGRPRVASAVQRSAMEALKSNQVAIHDFYRHEGDNRMYLAVLVPILDSEKGDRPLGVFVMRIDPEQYLYPLIQRWPASSRTAETFLVRQNGNDAEYLNELRFLQDSALSLGDPLKRTDSLAVKAVLGGDGILEGVDYRGEHAVAAVRRVPDQPWVLVAKMDLSEVHAPVLEWLWSVVALVGVLLVSAGAGMGLLWRQQRLHFYRKHYDAAEALRKSEALNRNLLEHLPHRILIKNRDSVYISCNAVYAKDLGILPEQIVGTDDFAYFPEELAASYRADDQAVMSSGTQKDIEEKYIVGGEECWIHTTKVPFTDGEGQVVGVLVTFEDITGRKRAEEALRESERFAQATLNGLSSSIAILDETGHIVTVNDAWRRFARENGAELDRVCEGAGYLDVCDSAMGLDSGIARDVATGIRDIAAGRRATFSIEYPCHSPDEKRWFLCLLTKFPGEGPSRVVIAHENITERKLVEIALRASEVRYRRLFESAQYGVMILDAKTGMVVDVNPFLVKMLEYSREQFLEKRIWELGFFKNIIADRDAFFDLRQNEYVRHDNLPFKSANGQQYIAEFVSNS
ncbi:MAG: PAS domain-containing protein, partial [Candidatus Hydrogenedentales bacterium]